MLVLACLSLCETTLLYVSKNILASFAIEHGIKFVKEEKQKTTNLFGFEIYRLFIESI